MGEDIKLAIDTPRPHHQLVPMKIFYEIGAKMVECILKMCNCMLICIKVNLTFKQRLLDGVLHFRLSPKEMCEYK